MYHKTADYGIATIKENDNSDLRSPSLIICPMDIDNKRNWIAACVETVKESISGYIF